MSNRPKDSAFTLLFRDAERVVDLYEFLTGKRIDPSAIEIKHLKDSWYKARLYNDVSFLTSDNELLVLIEHQSTLNPNMTFRLLEYYVKLAGEHVKETGQDKLGTAQLKIPKANFYVVYNGKGQMNELPMLDLGDVQVNAKTKNIHFETLPDKRPDNTLAGYARFIDLIEKGVMLDEALDHLVEEGYLVDFLSQKEMRNMFVEVFSYDNQLRQEGLQKGRQEGLQEGLQEAKIEIARTSLENGLDPQTISVITGLGIEFIEELKSQL